MMKYLSVSSVLALALAGAAYATPQDPPADDGFNLSMPDEVAESSDDGWNLGIVDDVPADGYAIPEGTVQDRLGDVAEISTGEAAKPEISADIPEIKTAEDDDLIRLD